MKWTKYLSLLLSLCLFVGVWPTLHAQKKVQEKARPLSIKDILIALANRKNTSRTLKEFDDYVMQRIIARGVSEILDEENVKRLRDAGASPELIKVIREHSLPKPTPTPTLKPTPTPTPPVQKPIPKPAEPDRIVLPNSSRENLNDISLEMIEVPAGKFTMGSDQSDDEKPPHQVSVQSFYMGKYEVTQKQWKAVMGNNPAYFKGDDLPVETVSWDDAQAFCKKLQELTGRAYRLPSEAEWEYACRAGTTGDYAGKLDAMAWYDIAWYDKNYDKNSDSKTHPVGQKQKNAFGLFDMHGNVSEWCEDVWHENYNDVPKDGTVWTSGGNSDGRVLRGGSYDVDARGCRAASRYHGTPNARFNNLGFRCVISARTL